MSSSLLEIGNSSKLALNNLPEANVGTLQDSKGKKLAREIIIKYTPSQAYVILQELDKSIAGKEIKVKNEDSLNLKLVSIETEKENRRLLPIAQQFHSVSDYRTAECHLSDLLSTHSLGRFNLELKKNVTIDSFEIVDAWRDDAGFIVTDRNIFIQATFDTSKLLPTLNPSSQIAVEYKKSDFDSVADFDNTVCGFSRDAFLELLLNNSNVLIVKNDSVDGLISGNGEQIYALYAETIELAHSLLKAYIQKYKLKQVTLFTLDKAWECAPIKSRPVYRRHTRTVPSSLKWTKIYALNMGSHIV